MDEAAPARNYIVHGAGAVGSVVAARLATAGADVSLVARGAHLEALAARGLRVEGLTEGVFDLPAVGDAHELPIDGGAAGGGAAGDGAAGNRAAGTVVVLAMKTQDTFAAVRAHADLYRCLPVVCFQNGVSNEEWLTDQGFCAYGAMVRIGAFVDRPGVVCHTAGRLALLGRWPGGVDPLCRAVVDDLARGGLDAAVETDIRAVKWGKLVINLVNAYLALADLSVQDSLHDPDVRSFMADVEQEAADVTEAAGITVSIDGETGLRGRIARLRRPAARVLRTGGAWSGVSYASTWQDLKAGRPTVEVDHFNGRIVELGEQHGIATPLNRVLRERCTDAAARGLGPGTETEASIRAAAAG